MSRAITARVVRFVHRAKTLLTFYTRSTSWATILLYLCSSLSFFPFFFLRSMLGIHGVDRVCIYIYIYMCVCVQAARRKNVQTRQLRDKKETNDAHVVRRRYSFKNSRWILDDDTNRCQSNLSSLFFYFHFLLERLFVRNISFPSEYNPRVFFFFVPFSFFFLFDLARIVRPREIPPQFVAPSTDS